jgi:hypothetical protein
MIVRKNRWRIVYTNSLPEDIWGQCEPDRRIIFIAKQLTPMNRRLALFHEVRHKLDFRRGIPMNEDNAWETTRNRMRLKSKQLRESTWIANEQLEFVYV